MEPIPFPRSRRRLTIGSAAPFSKLITTRAVRVVDLEAGASIDLVAGSVISVEVADHISVTGLVGHEGRIARICLPEADFDTVTVEDVR